MSSNVGLSTPRGSGTSGYVQRNLSHLRVRDNPYPPPSSSSNSSSSHDPSRHQAHRQRQPDADILEHDRRREIELRVFELRDRLEDGETGGDDDWDEDGNDDGNGTANRKKEKKELTEDEIDEACDALRQKLEREFERERAANKMSGADGSKVKGLKSHQVHELARAKIEESNKLRRALGIREDYEEGGHWRRQEEREREGRRNAPRGP